MTAGFDLLLFLVYKRLGIIVLTPILVLVLAVYNCYLAKLVITRIGRACYKRLRLEICSSLYSIEAILEAAPEVNEVRSGCQRYDEIPPGFVVCPQPGDEFAVYER